MRKLTVVFMFALLLPYIGSAQRYLGIATSNWSGTNGMYLNPANIADSRHKFTIDLFSVNLGVNNNMAEFKDGISGMFNLSDSINASDIFAFDNSKSEFSLLLPYVEIRGPGAMVSINSKHSIAISTRVRVINQFHNFNQDLYRNLVDQSFRNAPGQPVYAIRANEFNLTTHAWSEIGLSYGGVIYDGGKHVVKGGITLRYLRGSAYLSFTSDGLSATAYPTSDSMVLSNTNISYGSNVANGSFGSDFSDLIKGNGRGFGGDIGFVYEWRPDAGSEKYKYDMDGETGVINRGMNKYKLRVSAAVTDFGSIKYSDNNFTTNIRTIAGQTAVIKGSELIDSISNYNDLRTYAANNNLAVDSGTNNATSTLVLPTSIVASVDYHAVSNLYVNAMFVGNMASRTKYGNSVYGQFTLTPRWDTRVFSAGIPLTYDFLTQSLKYGLGLRVGGFFLGSDDLAGVFGDAKGVNFYFGAYVPFNYKKPKDSDGDKISNRKDKCKHEKGIWEEMGCPSKDRDGDGILDIDDRCPDVAGSKTANGCPDADLDGVADAEDRCPNEAGLPAMAGCPDRDADGVADIDDNCPDVPGLAQYKGCPDTDNDGLPDNEDKCPEKPGPLANEGCPDTDNDGIADHMDKCPDVAGTQENYGCPEVAVEVKKRLAFAATAIQFDLGKASIKSSSNKILDEIVQILKDYPDYNMTIDGYTDNTGRAERNLELSKERANSVRDYFISKGIDANRLMADGHGDANPVASNKTRAGRAKNRRVEMDLKLKP